MLNDRKCTGSCTGTATKKQVIKVGRCENVGKNPPQKLVIDTYVAAVEDAQDDCEEGCTCIIRQKATKVVSRCQNLPGKNGHEWTCTVTVSGSCEG